MSESATLADGPGDARLPFVKSRSWVCPKNSRPRLYRVGFDRDNRPVRFERLGSLHERRALVVAWRTACGAWVGKYRADTGYVTARLSPAEVAYIEAVGRIALTA
ncbi:hypothetical protein [Azospirillum sp. SYSU D00513]|uniref:hypothetical protein n=1 Tax=Azospirillum sp. SYSU D00513 TaxID=2812561 RepID=UPI001A971580|nr:hypothetical protein [Azospirillum sp. SYSU D00513]